MQVIHVHFERSKATYASHSDTSYIKNAIKYGKEKLDKYFGKLVLDVHPSLYCVATALHPKLRMLWFKKHWGEYPTWHARAEKSLRKVFQHYVTLQEQEEEEYEETPEPPSRRRVPGDQHHAVDLYEETMTVDPMMMTGVRSFKKQRVQDELDRYLSNY